MLEGNALAALDDGKKKLQIHMDSFNIYSVFIFVFDM